MKVCLKKKPSRSTGRRSWRRPHEVEFDLARRVARVSAAPQVTRLPRSRERAANERPQRAGRDQMVSITGVHGRSRSLLISDADHSEASAYMDANMTLVYGYRCH